MNTDNTFRPALPAQASVPPEAPASYGAAPKQATGTAHGSYAAMLDFSASGRARIDGLIGIRLAKLRLPADLRAVFWAGSANTRRLTLSSWCGWVAGFGVISLFMGLACLPRSEHGLGVTSSTIVTAAFLIASQIIYHRILAAVQEYVVTVPVLLTVALSLSNGFYSHQQGPYLIYIIMSVAIIWSFATYAQVPFRVTTRVSLAAMALLAGVTWFSPLPNLPEKCLLITFVVVVTAGMVNARRVQNIYQHRLFLLQVRDEMRTAEMAELNAQLGRIAYTDRLTGLPNRRRFDEQMALYQAGPEGCLPLAVCLIDIDHFKKLNDRLGHVEGDRCLRLVGAALQNNLRHDDDMAARYGGEEFVLVLPNTNLVAATQLANRLRLAVRALNFANPDTAEGFVTISTGIAVAEGGVNTEALVVQADRALYRAKTGGRNQVCV
jgi:diguanylate cyclase (GGDEF)-like protein